MRKLLSHAFSQRSLIEQESLVSTAVDRFINKIGSVGGSDEGLDITKWFNIMTFDIIGDLAFGETFRGIESGIYHSPTPKGPTHNTTTSTRANKTPPSTQAKPTPGSAA